ncbi:hypothetical protein [Massilia sp. Leaf139]|uniref:hypothetical protein n=1 Tax=Massilia sp. Leaf139 TaxID=1736272 RepID=UPI0006F1FC35|nr:hypothetical protein [Massilia sp. Leaf139]KQQ91679.1 hypothetical protein ASF77_07040 [Massilia sp. Leaf139]
MNAATITQAQDARSRGAFEAIRNFAEQLFAAQGGWIAARKARASQASYVVSERAGRAELFALAADAEKHSPNLAAELRWLANR